MHIWRPQVSFHRAIDCVPDSCEEMGARDNGRSIDKGVFEFGVAGNQLSLEKGSVGYVAKQSSVYPVVWGNMFEGDALEGHGRVGRGFGTFRGG